eukprot:5763629-Prymnesium_polylepis.1
MATSPQATARTCLCLSEPSQRTERSCSRKECSSRSSYEKEMQCHARNTAALTLGVKQNARINDAGSQLRKPSSTTCFSDRRCAAFPSVDLTALLGRTKAAGGSTLPPACRERPGINGACGVPALCATLTAAPTSGIAITRASGANARKSSVSTMPAPTTQADGMSQFVHSRAPKTRIHDVYWYQKSGSTTE